MHYISDGIDLKELGSDVEMFEILPRDWNLQPNFTQKWAFVDMNWGWFNPNPLAIPTLHYIHSLAAWLENSRIYSMYEFFMCLVPQTVRSASVSQTFPRVQW